MRAQYWAGRKASSRWREGQRSPAPDCFGLQTRSGAGAKEVDNRRVAHTTCTKRLSRMNKELILFSLRGTTRRRASTLS